MTQTATPEPIFIVGMNGSGTTMLLDCLNNHNQLYGFHQETKLIPYFIKKLSKYGELSCDDNFLSLFSDFRSLSYFRYLNNGELPPLPENWRALPRSLDSVIDSVLGFFAKREGKIRWCEKTPMHALHIKNLNNLFPHAKFIHAIRDGRACAASFYRRWRYTPELTMYRWKKVIREARHQGSSIDNQYLEIKYDELTENPEQAIRKICSFLQIPFDNEMLIVNRRRNYMGFSFTKIMQNKSSLNEVLSKSQIERIELIGGKLLNELGYESKYPNSDIDPHIVMLKYWLYKDYIKRGCRTLIQEIKRPRERKWDDLSAIFIRAVKQRLTSKY
jgi:hypothetical protein